MDSLRITKHPVLGSTPVRKSVSFSLDGEQLYGMEGEPVTAALLAGGVRLLRRHEASGSPRGLYCGIGHCMECRLTIEGLGVVRACLTPLQEGMSIRRGQQLEQPIKGGNHL